MVVAGDQDAPPGKVLGQGFVAVDELHHAVGQLKNGPHFTFRHTAERVQRPPRNGGGDREVDHRTHEGASFV